MKRDALDPTLRSLCFQFPSLYLSSVAGKKSCSIIVSPLLALISDQTAALTSKKLFSCALNGETSADTWARALDGEYSYIYTTPETAVGNAQFKQVLRRLYALNQLDLFAVDGAYTRRLNLTSMSSCNNLSLCVTTSSVQRLTAFPSGATISGPSSSSCTRCGLRSQASQCSLSRLQQRRVCVSKSRSLSWYAERHTGLRVCALPSSPSSPPVSTAAAAPRPRPSREHLCEWKAAGSRVAPHFRPPALSLPPQNRPNIFYEARLSGVGTLLAAGLLSTPTPCRRSAPSRPLQQISRPRSSSCLDL